MAEMQNLNFNITANTSGLDRATNSVDRFGRSVRGSMNQATTSSRNTTREFGACTRAANNMGSAFSKIARTIGTAFVISKIVNFSKSCVQLGSDLAEVQNVVDVTFGTLNTRINEFAQNAAAQFGLSETMAKQFTGTMGAMFKSMGLTTDQAADMSMTLSGLAGDMASFYNISQEEAFNKIRAGISGEVEPLRQLGINMSVANLEAYALSQGITTAYQNMDQASQAILRYNYLMSVTGDAQGDFARTSGKQQLPRLIEILGQ